ncbi:hypothetical protein [Flavobacterium sp. 3HN19-14]|uniref:hypothetical protein n=1 Tax=Flavobacterium sp. 3HN19-14 TaxID=3448133 RepID=UPI003EDFA714
MKMRKLSYYLLGLLALGGFALSCSKDYIENDVDAATLEQDYYKNEGEAYSGLISVYDILKKHTGGFENAVTFFNAASDDFYAGGGSATDGAGIHGISDYSITRELCRAVTGMTITKAFSEPI